MYTIGDVIYGGGFYHTTTSGPIAAQLANLDLVTPTGFQSVAERNALASAAGGVPVYYSNGFLSAGAGQTGGGGGVLSAITSGLETFLPKLLAGGTGSVPISTRTPPIIAPAGGVVARTMGGITKVASQHPVLTAAGGAAATIAGAVVGARTIRGHKVVQTAAGTMIVRHHRRMNPCNIHALRRGLRRASAFERIAKRVLHITSPRKHVSGFKLPHRRKK